MAPVLAEEKVTNGKLPFTMAAPGSSRLENPISPRHLPGLDADFVAYYNSKLAVRKFTHQAPIEEVRSNPAKWNSPWCEDTSKLPGVKDIKVASYDGYEFTIRVYSPVGESAGAGPFPVHINYHGGGFMFGDLTSDSAYCKLVRERLDITVVDVDYRLCPEFKYGKNIEDAWAALSYVHSHADELNILADSISVGGISAGGLYSAILQHMARDVGIKLKLAVLAVPPTAIHTNYKKPSDSPFESFTTMADAPSLDWPRISYFQKYVFPPEHQEYLDQLPQWWRSPLKCTNFRGLSDTFLVTAEFDPVRDEGEAYAQLLVKGGNKVTFKRYLGVPHPFMHMPIKKTDEYNDDVCAALYAAHELHKRKA